MEAPIFGKGMEHATLVTMDESLFRTAARSRSVTFHELAHHWSGNLVRIATWNDLWLSEGFSDYLTGRYIESHDGPAGGLVQWQEILRQGLLTEHAMRNDALLALRPGDPEADPLRMFTLIVYKHGAFALRMLEAAVGREALTTYQARQGSMTDDGVRIARASKVPRNAACPCGSGKKWKKCCGSVLQPQ